MPIQSLESNSHIELPLPPAKNKPMEMEIYARFMRHLRNVPNSKKEIKILAAIQFTADMTDNSDAHVAKVLVDQGLRAPRLAFPAQFLKHADQIIARSLSGIFSLSNSYKELKAYWRKHGEGRFAYLQQDFGFAETPLVRESV